MDNLFQALQRGYFAEELPQTFNTDLYAHAITSHDLPGHFDDKNKQALMLKHGIPNLKLRRRIAGVPNPITHRLLTKNILVNWEQIQTHISKSEISMSKVELRPNFTGRFITMKYGFSGLKEAQLSLRSSSRYILKTDIARFYGSIYTHSIPWALHGKEISKKNYSDELLGNLLDKNVRNNQSRQTVGIPIGPDTSLVIAEMILTAFDVNLQREVDCTKAVRLSDDIEIGFKSFGDAERALNTIRSLLNDFELELNDAKTEIVELPLPTDAIWVMSLRKHRFRSKVQLQRSDLISYFNTVFHYANLYPKDHVLNYSISRLSNVKIHAKNWQLVQGLLSQCVMSDAGTLYRVLKFLYESDQKGHEIDLLNLEEMINHIIIQACSSRYSNEIAWALWAAINWNIQIDSEPTHMLSDIDDSIVALSALHANELSLFRDQLDISNWLPYVSEQAELYGSQWLLAYEANIKNWLPFEEDHVRGDKHFRFLQEHGVSFYDRGRIKNPLRKQYSGYPIQLI